MWNTAFSHVHRHKMNCMNQTCWGPHSRTSYVVICARFFFVWYTPVLCVDKSSFVLCVLPMSFCASTSELTFVLGFTILLLCIYVHVFFVCVLFQVLCVCTPKLSFPVCVTMVVCVKRNHQTGVWVNRQRTNTHPTYATRHYVSNTPTGDGTDG